MAIIADILDLAAAEFLLMLARTEKSGKLAAVDGEEKVMLGFRNGSIVYAASTAIRERVGSMLVSRGLLTEINLKHAIDIQQATPGVRHLGNILVDLGFITQEALAEVVRTQFQQAVMELLSWKQGILTFNRMDIPNLGAVHVNPREILGDMDFETEQLVLDGISELADAMPDESAAPSAAAVAEPMSGEVSDEAHDLMRSMMQEMHSLSFSITAEISLEILTTALQTVSRAMLLAVYPNHVGGVGGFGFQRADMVSEEVVRNFLIPRDQESIFTWMISTGQAFQGQIGGSPYDHQIIDQLGGFLPPESIGIPLVVQDQVVAILYGDNGTTGEPIACIDELSCVMVAIAATQEEAYDPAAP